MSSGALSISGERVPRDAPRRLRLGQAADGAAEKLKAMVNTTATVVRDGQDAEVPLKMLVPGDIVRLNAGDVVPADLRILSRRGLGSPSRPWPARSGLFRFRRFTGCCWASCCWAM